RDRLAVRRQPPPPNAPGKDDSHATTRCRGRKRGLLRPCPGYHRRARPVADHRLAPGCATVPPRTASGTRCRTSGGRDRHTGVRVRPVRGRRARYPGTRRTPAHLVVGGLYPYVRHPIYLALDATILGQAILLWRPDLWWYMGFVALALVAWVYGLEQPELQGRFGARYDEYRRAVPGWWPRRRPWQPR